MWGKLQKLKLVNLFSLMSFHTPHWPINCLQLVCYSVLSVTNTSLMRFDSHLKCFCSLIALSLRCSEATDCQTVATTTKLWRAALAAVRKHCHSVLAPDPPVVLLSLITLPVNKLTSATVSNRRSQWMLIANYRCECRRDSGPSLT